MFYYELFWNIEYKEYPEVCSKIFDDFIEYIIKFCTDNLFYKKFLILKYLNGL